MKNVFFRMALIVLAATISLTFSSFAKADDMKMSSPKKMAPMTYSGYLADKLCADAGTAFDGANMKTNPENHTLKCLLAKQCVASGFGLMMKDKDAKEYVFYKFDSKGDKLTKKLLAATKKQKDFFIEVVGTMYGKTIKVKSLKEAAPKM